MQSSPPLRRNRRVCLDVRSEADREGRRAGDLPEVPAVPVGGQLPETPGSDEGGEEDLTGRPPGALAAVGPGEGRKSFTGPERGRKPGSGTGLACGAAERIERVMTTTETELKISEELLAERVQRQVRSGELDESRLLPSAEKRARDVGKKLDRLASRQGWYTFMAGQAYAVATGKAPLEAERGGHGGGAGHALAVGGVAVRAQSASGVSLEQVDA